MKIFFCIDILFLNVALAFANTCATFERLSDNEYYRKLDEVDSIFEGEILSITNLGYHSYLIRLKVLRVWKGEKAKEITIKYGDPCSYSETISSSPGKIIYGYKQENDMLLSVSCCRPFDDARMKLVYGEGEAIEHPEDLPAPPRQNAGVESYWSWLLKIITALFS